MKQRKIKHYRSGYMSRKRRRNKILKTAAFLMVLAALIFTGYLIAQSVSQMGNAPSDSSASTSESSFQSALPESSDDSSLTESSEPQTPESTDNGIRSLLLPTDQMSNLSAVEAFLKTVDTSLYNSITVELKNADGQLLYTSKSELALRCGAIKENAADAEQLAQLIQQHGFTPIARIYALQDDYASHASYGTAYLYENDPNVTWLDNAADAGGKSWLNPYMDNTADYLNDLVAEIAQAGFSTIVVNGLQYPYTANQRGMGLGENASAMTTAEALEHIRTGLSKTAAAHHAAILPAYLGECYQGNRSQIYTVNPNIFPAAPVSPIVGSDLTILEAVAANKADLIPTIDSEAQISLLEQQDIQQYLVG